MGSAARSIGVTFHPPSRQYKKTIGRRRGPDGKPRPQVFYLGTDQREAKNRAFLLMTEWDRLQTEGANFWPEGTTGAAVMEQDSISPRKSENSRPDAERLVQPGELTVEDAARIYIGEQERRLSTKQVPAAHVRHMRYRIGRVVEIIGGQTPLVDVDRDELQRAVDHFLKRPPVRRHEEVSHVTPRANRKLEPASARSSNASSNFESDRRLSRLRDFSTAAPKPHTRGYFGGR